MLKLLALFDRYHNVRGPHEARHDREEARTHSADIVAVLKAQLDPTQRSGVESVELSRSGKSHSVSRFAFWRVADLHSKLSVIRFL